MSALVGLLTMCAATAAAEDPTYCRDGGPVLDNGRVWCADEASLSLRQLVERVAPILWLSPDEPVTDPRGPWALPWEGVKSRRTAVYVDAVLVGAPSPTNPFDRVPVEWTEPTSLVGLRFVELGFFFYYPTDTGVGGHKYDLEKAWFRLAVNPPSADPTCGYSVYLVAIKSHAHGLDLFSNWLDISSEPSAWHRVAMPPTLFVEEGKHAMAPDANADGLYTPGFDTTRNLNEAWGVRDVTSSGDLFPPAYRGFMTKGRRASERLRAQVSCQPAFAEDRGNDIGHTYEVIPLDADIVRRCDSNVDRPSRKPRILDVCGELRRVKGVSGFYSSDRKTLIIRDLGVAARVNGEFWGPRLSGPRLEVPRVGGWAGLSMSVGHSSRLETTSVSIDVSYTPSLSRWASWYAALGLEWVDKIRVTQELADDPRNVRYWRYDRAPVGGLADALLLPALEGGYRFRVPWKNRLFGLDVGVRVDAARILASPRVTAALGLGPF
ncbi:MAG: hypothetical protein R2745_07680 [Vicinamibacterales bacterium]